MIKDVPYMSSVAETYYKAVADSLGAIIICIPNSTIFVCLLNFLAIN